MGLRLIFALALCSDGFVDLANQLHHLFVALHGLVDGLDHDSFAFGDARFLSVLDDRDFPGKSGFQDLEHVPFLLFLRASVWVAGLATYPAVFAGRLFIAGLVALFVDTGRVAKAIRVVRVIPGGSSVYGAHSSINDIKNWHRGPQGIFEHIRRLFILKPLRPLVEKTNANLKLYI